MHDITLVSVPYTIVESPPLGISVLKGAVETEGFACRTLDLGMELFVHCNKNRKLFDSVQQYLSANTISSPETISSLDRFIDHWSHALVATHSRWIGISVFSYYAHHASFLLSAKIKQLNPDQKIVLGGAGASVKIQETLWDQFAITGLEKLLDFGEILKKRNLVNELIIGDGEQALIDLLRNDWVSPGFHMEPYRDKQQNHAYANFDDFDLSRYEGQLNRGSPQLPVFSSKGCVRNCDFCDVNVIQNKFRFRTGKNIVDEMIYLADRYGIRDFIFFDSLTNGSMKSLREWCTELANFNLQNPDRKITWSASGWICRPIGQMPEDFYVTLAQSGLQSVTIGIESGSNNVLKAMNKKTNVEALYHEVEQFRKNDIKFIGLLIIGHWAEQWEDFLATAVMVYKLSRYSRLGNLVALNAGGTFKIIEDTPADRDTHVNQLIKQQKNLWWTPLNPGLTAKERYFRLMLLERLMHELKIPNMQQVTAGIKLEIEKNFELMDKFYTDVTKELDARPAQHSEYYYDRFYEFLDLVIKRAGTKDSVDFVLELESSVTNDDPPVIEIITNGSSIFRSPLAEGVHTIAFNEMVLNEHNSLEIKFTNKQNNDTLVDTQGNIVKDKFVKIKKFVVDDFDLFEDQEFFYNRLHYTENGVKTTVKPGFWLNDSCLGFTFDRPFDLWYHRSSNRFSQFDGFLITNLTLPDARSRDQDEDHRRPLVNLLKKMTY